MRENENTKFKAGYKDV